MAPTVGVAQMLHRSASSVILSEIEGRLHFVPPFFSPAAEHPELLANLWQQTKSAYLDNPLPDLFKEKLAALLGHYCEVPYCLVCHTCTLHPLGMRGPAIVELLARRLPSDEHVLASMQRVDALASLIAFPISDESLEGDIFNVCSAVYSGGVSATLARECLRRRLSAADYRNLIVFTAYNKMCHEWMAAHPEVSYEVDQRYLQNYAPIAAEAPAIADFITGGALLPARSALELEGVARQRAEEAVRSVEITERRFLDVLGNLNASIAAATQHATQSENLAQELRRSSDFAQELLAIVSHDLRNPLNVVLMGAELIAQIFPDHEKVAKPLKRVVSAARRAERMIHDLLDFSQARAGGGIPIHLQPTDLHDLARRATEDLQLAHSSRSIRLTHAGDGLGELDPDRLTQVFSNLLSNAIAHGRDGHPIELSTRGSGERLWIEVRNANRGGPIPDDLMPVLFDPFKRGVARAISRTRSIGLGLYIVDQIVKGHRGRVDVVSTTSDDTTTFVIELPRRASSLAIGPRPSSEAAGGP